MDDRKPAATKKISLEELRSMLQAEQPTIDSALKSYASWCIAQKSPAAILPLVRWLSITVNSHIHPIRASPSPVESVLTQLWNEVVAMKQKPTKVFGRTALKTVWNELELYKSLPKEEGALEFVKVFEQFLFDEDANDTDASLIWKSGELERRAMERQEKATIRRQQELEQQKEALAAAISPRIEEITEEDDQPP